LGVIVGIGLTFGISYLVQRHSEQKQLHEIMVLLKKELADNKEHFEYAKTFFESDCKAYNTFLSADWRTMPQDSLTKHIAQFRMTYFLPIRNNTWSIFQNTAAFQNFGNKELCVFLLDFYRAFDMIKAMWAEYNKDRSAAREIFVPYLPTDPYAYVDAALKNDATKRFFEATAKYDRYKFSKILEEFADVAEYLTILVDQSGNYRYEFRDIFGDFAEFRKNKREGVGE
jgi:hypothetical protein